LFPGQEAPQAFAKAVIDVSLKVDRRSGPGLETQVADGDIFRATRLDVHNRRMGSTGSSTAKPVD
jgi:hypothetical protein